MQSGTGWNWNTLVMRKPAERSEVTTTLLVYDHFGKLEHFRQ
jgi:hypothetical protein